MKSKILKLSLAFFMVLTLVFGGIIPGITLKADAWHVTETSMYNTQLLSSYETSVTYGLAPGTVIVMHPGSDRTVYTYWSAESRVRNNTVRTVVMAGVGSSSHGTAAMAKQMANILGVPVAGVVTGWGDSSIWYYGTQGYFIGRDFNTSGNYYSNAASYKLYEMYINGARPIRVVGHSKGSFDIANALFRLRNESRSSMFSNTLFISLGIGVNRPAGLYGYRGYLGTADSLGETNTTNWSSLTRPSGREHHLKTTRANFLPVDSNTLAR